WNYAPRLAFVIRPSGSLAQPPKRRNSESGEQMTPSAEILDALPVAVYTTDAQGRITYYNQAAEDLWGHRPKIGSDQWCGSWRLFWPDGRLLPHDECPMAVTLKEGHPCAAWRPSPNGLTAHGCRFCPTRHRCGMPRASSSAQLICLWT